MNNMKPTENKRHWFDNNRGEVTINKNYSNIILKFDKGEALKIGINKIQEISKLIEKKWVNSNFANT